MKKEQNIIVVKGFDLVAFRTARSMTLAQLWKASKVPYAKLARIEHGESVELTAEEGTRLARCIKIEARLFEQPRKAMIADRATLREQQNVGRRSVDDVRIEQVRKHMTGNRR